MRNIGLRITAVFLMLVLIQGPGLRLVVHNALHKKAVSNTAAEHGKGNLQAYCDCLDEALMPSTETPAFVLTVPQQDVVTLETACSISLSTITKIFHSLRAPPAATV